MTGSAVGSILQYFGWNIVGIIAERQVDIIWLHTRRGLHYAFERMNITIAMSTLMEGDTGLENYLLETAKVSRGKAATGGGGDRACSPPPPQKVKFI